MSRPPVTYATYMLLTFGVLMAGLCGLCTASLTAWTLPAALFEPRGSAGYAWMLLFPTLIVGGVATAAGASMFRRGRREMKAARKRGPDRFDQFASALTLATSALFVIACFALTARMSLTALADLSDPDPMMRRGVGGWLAVVLAIGCAEIAAGLVFAWGALKRLQAALRRTADGDVFS